MIGASWQRRFADAPIRTKLLLVLVSTTSLSLLLGGAGILISDSLLFRDYLERDLQALAQIIADNSTASLAFDDPNVAAETLGALRARNHLISACVFRADGSELAHYLRAGTEAHCPRPGNPGVSFGERAVTVTRPVILAQRKLGSLVLLYDLNEIGERRLLYGGTVLAILLASSLVAGMLSARLRRRITVPISRLAETATTVSRQQNYGIRAEKMSNDEMGILVDRFNEMLSTIEARDEELRLALAAKEEINRRLTRSNEDLERFAYVASHDLQEPLRMITVYTQLLARRSPLGAAPESAEIVGKIVGGTERMRELLRDLLTYAELGAPADARVTVDLNTALAKAQANLEAAIRQSGAAVTSDPLPPIQAYEGHIVPLFQNLIGNAIKYRSQAPPRITVTCRRDPGAGTLEIAVEDNGIGIAPEYHSRIFVPFRRLHGAEIAGSGIGLSICQRVAERYGGSIRVESELGQGAVFRIQFPGSIVAEAHGREAEAKGRGAEAKGKEAHTQ